jgi:hypothetical protein
VSLVSASYQRKEKPVKLASCRVLLNENTTMKINGIYKKRYTIAIHALPK